MGIAKTVSVSAYAYAHEPSTRWRLRRLTPSSSCIEWIQFIGDRIMQLHCGAITTPFMCTYSRTLWPRVSGCTAALHYTTLTLWLAHWSGLLAVCVDGHMVGLRIVFPFMIQLGMTATSHTARLRCTAYYTLIIISPPLSPTQPQRGSTPLCTVGCCRRCCWIGDAMTLYVECS